MKKNSSAFKRRLTDRLEENVVSDLVSISDQQVEHENETWLLSYADMMTLLFGLFVMLYSIAMDTQGRPEKVFSDIVTGRSSYAEIESQIKKKEVDLAAAKKEIADLTNQMNDKVQKLSFENSQSKEFISQLQSELDELKKLSIQNKISASNKKEIANTNLSDQKVELAKLKQSVQSLTKDIENYKSNISLLSSENTKFKSENVKLMSDIRSTNFMVIVLNWTTAQHDIDLRVTDPFGRMFDFGNRFYKESKAKFIVDSRTGPGVEVWEAPVVENGEYTVEFNFYNSYGNTAPASMVATVITKMGTFDIPTFKLDFKSNKKKIFKIKIDDSGRAIIQPSTLQSQNSPPQS